MKMTDRTNPRSGPQPAAYHKPRLLSTKKVENQKKNELKGTVPVEEQVLTHETAPNSQDKSIIKCGINYVVWNLANEIHEN